ncbi:MAG: PaaR repeat-containing protein [Nitrospirae bacterium]|nr:PaaR repeat-containing protein [Nitrospirota bacterium]
MPSAARVGDMTNHGGTVSGPGIPNVLIGGMPAAVATDIHVCALPPNTHQPTSSPFPMGSTTVMIGGKPALRVGDACICGASAAIGEPTVDIGG